MRHRIGFWISVLLILLFLLSNGACRAGAAEGLRICGTVLIPALFPFSVLSGLWIRSGFPAASRKRFAGITKHLFALPGQAAVPLALGALGGYPLGIHVLAELFTNKALTRAQASRLSAFCNNPGPAFLLGAVGATVLDSQALGILLYGIAVLSALFTGMLLAPSEAIRSDRFPRDAGTEQLAEALPKAIQSAALGMLRLTGIVVFFSAIRGVVFHLLPLWKLPDWGYSTFSGAFELTAGILSLSFLALPLRFFLCAILCCWGGVCVHLQAAEALLTAGLPFRPYLAGKLLQTLIAGILAGAILPWLFPIHVENLPVLRTAVLFPLFLLLFFLFFKKCHWKQRRSVL